VDSLCPARRRGRVGVIVGGEAMGVGAGVTTGRRPRGRGLHGWGGERWGCEIRKRVWHVGAGVWGLGYVQPTDRWASAESQF
jgi:hypothetical protein